MWVIPDNVVPTAVFTTVTGTDLLMVVPSPSRPEPLFPQQRAVESARTAQVCSEPAEMVVALRFQADGPVNAPVVALNVTPEGNCPVALKVADPTAPVKVGDTTCEA
jgi:hypothetical protein